MKKIVVTLSLLMVLVLMIGTYMYEKQPAITLPESGQPKEEVEQRPETLHPINEEIISYSL